tara:strand:+ start:5668 stop:6687 length:1020 start_codon:yes stop_codon:yes gene_type:complete
LSNSWVDKYKLAGVDRNSAEKLKNSLASIAKSSHGPEVLSGIGGFGGLYKLASYKNPVLVSSTDGVGTKLLLGKLTGNYKNLGIDLVNACLNDVIVSGADPLFFLDYIAIGKIDQVIINQLVSGMSLACESAGCALIGGETAEMPGIYREEDFDMAGFVVGAVEEDELLNPDEINVGDSLVGIPSSGIHTNGFSLIRKVFNIENNHAILTKYSDTLGRTLAEEISEPHRSYVKETSIMKGRVKSLAHITGGGLTENMPRSLPRGIGAKFYKESWKVPVIFDLIQSEGDISLDEMNRVFNMGIGMIAICDSKNVDYILESIPHTSVIGETISSSESKIII